MLAIEVFRPDEMQLILKQKENKKLLKNLQKQKEEQADNPYIVIEDEFDKEFYS